MLCYFSSLVARLDLIRSFVCSSGSRQRLEPSRLGLVRIRAASIAPFIAAFAAAEEEVVYVVVPSGCGGCGGVA